MISAENWRNEYEKRINIEPNERINFMNEYEVLVNKLSSEKIAQYLVLNGWSEDVPIFNGRVRQFINPGDSDAILLPMDNGFSDYSRSIIRVIETIAKYENISVKGMFGKLINEEEHKKKSPINYTTSEIVHNILRDILHFEQHNEKSEGITQYIRNKYEKYI